ncbi:hypothetical protein FKP32DRAFT_791980 [Trametes sanguinea]|nr:hypothetical protein FKP32DRAFT_791980 [Trametes sanguinea]
MSPGSERLSFDPRKPSYYPRPRAVPSEVGLPVKIEGGPLLGRRIIARLQEIQKADLGRKYARKDKRPLDPPPVVLCRLFEVVDGPNGIMQELEVEPGDDVMHGMICHLDLFPVPWTEPQIIKSEDLPRHTVNAALPPVQTGLTAVQPAIDAPSTYPPPLPLSGGGVGYGASLPWQQRQSAPPPYEPLPPLFPTYAHMQPAPPMMPLTFFAPPPPLAHLSSSALHVQPQAGIARCAQPANDPDVVGWFGDYAIRESSCCGTALGGETFTDASIVEYMGRPAAVFVFYDVAVKLEGSFVPRYRVFNVASMGETLRRAPILAECYGGQFHIYSTKDFPGLQASTELTKHLGRWGVRVNIRESPRKRRRKSEILADGDGDRDHKEDGNRNFGHAASAVGFGGWMAAAASAPTPQAGHGWTSGSSASGPPSSASPMSNVSPTIPTGPSLMSPTPPHPVFPGAPGSGRGDPYRLVAAWEPRPASGNTKPEGIYSAHRPSSSRKGKEREHEIGASRGRGSFGDPGWGGARV